MTKDSLARQTNPDAAIRSEETYRRIFENSTDGIFQSTPQGDLVNINPALARTLGYDSPEELLSTSGNLQYSIYANPADREKLLGLLAHSDTVKGFEVSCRKKDGGVVWVELNIRLVRDANGAVVFIEGMGRDITERRHMENSLRESEERFSTAFKATPYPYIIANLEDGAIIEVNAAFTSVSGYTREEVLGRSTLDLKLWVTDTDRERMVAVLHEYGSVTRFETRLRAKNTNIRTVLFSAQVIRQGTKSCILSIVEDITERKQAELALLESEEKYRNLVDHANQVIFVSQDGMCKFVNHKAVELWGYSEKEFLTRPFMEFVYPDDRYLIIENRGRRAKGGLPLQRYEFRIMTADGRICWIEINPVPIDWKGKEATLNLLTDITERKKTETLLANAQKLDSLGILAGGIAHDFNNLLTGIYGYIDLARSVSKGSKAENYLESTIATLGRARALTLQLLTFAKGGAPAQKITPIESIVQDAALFALSGSNISCRFSMAGDLWPCNIDKNQIGQVIDNIVINAQQAMPNGGSIEISAENQSFEENEHPPLVKGNYVRVSIKDNGIGIPKNIMPRIFDPFYTTKTKGHGLGLATCYSIINRHGGCIEVESEAGKGALFHVFLPASTEAALASVAANAGHRGSGTILVVDDEEVVRDTLRQTLESLGYAVVCKADGKEAVEYYNNEIGNGQLTAMIFDLTIPGGMGGLEIITQMRKSNNGALPKIPLFVVSGYADNLVMKNPVEYGFTASLTKPFTIAELSDMLNKIAVSG